MKTAHLSYLLFFLLLAFVSCSKACETEVAACNERPPTDEACQAFFTRWFYDKEKGNCESLSYSGCSERGFPTENECEECACK